MLLCFLVCTWVCISVLLYKCIDIETLIFLIGMKFNGNSDFLSACLTFDLALQSSKSSVTGSLSAYVGGKGTEKSGSCDKYHQKFYFLYMYVLLNIVMCSFCVGNGDGRFFS